MSNFIDVTSPEHFKTLLSADLNRVSCLNFWAPWAEPCAAFTEIVKGEAAKFSSVLFLNVSRESIDGGRRTEWYLDVQDLSAGSYGSLAIMFYLKMGIWTLVSLAV